MNFIRQTPFFRLLIPVVTGILSFQWLKLPVWSLWTAVGISFVFITGSFLFKNSSLQYKFRWLFGCGFFLFLAVLSYFLCCKAEKQSEFEHIAEKGIFLVELAEAPVEKDRSYLLKVNILQLSGSAATSSSYRKAYIYVQKDSIAPTLLVGDYVCVNTEFNSPEPIKNPGGFDYATYLKRQGIAATAYANSNNWVRIGSNEKFSLKIQANKCRNYLLDVYRKYGITGDEFAVLAALTLGYTDDLDDDLRKSYSASGAMHILAVSGLHVGIIYAVLSFVFSFLNSSTKKRILKTVIIVVLLWCYAFITGLPPSVFRSSLMFSFVAVGSLFNRRSLVYNTIFMSAFLMLLINPNLLFNVGFQLSYSAVLAIIYFQPKISGLIQISIKPLKWLWDLIAVSLAAQLGTAPFVLFYFQSFPNYFLLSNIIAIPAATIILYMAFALLAFSFIPYLPLAISFILKAVLSGLNYSMEFIRHLPFSTSVISVTPLQIVLLFLIICLISWYIHSKKYYPLAGSLAGVVLFFAINIQIKYDTLNARKIIVYAGNRHTHINLLDGDRNYVYTTDEDELRRSASTYWNNKKIKEPEYLQQTGMFTEGFIQFNNRKILILEEDFSRKYITPIPMKVDYLIVGNGLKPRIHQLLECIKPEMIIADKTITPWYTEQIRKACEERAISFYSVRAEGAFFVEWQADIKIKPRLFLQQLQYFQR